MERKELKLLEGIDTVIVRVSEINLAKEWYQNKLGLTILFEDSDRQLVVLDTNGPTSLTLWQTAQTIATNPETASYPIFKTPDAAALRGELINRGINTGAIVQDGIVTYFHFYDPDGNVLEACQVHD